VKGYDRSSEMCRESFLSMVRKACFASVVVRLRMISDIFHMMVVNTDHKSEKIVEENMAAVSDER
jgi:hypothetical protein